jgi:soluble lytic murein transglycosylase
VKFSFKPLLRTLWLAACLSAMVTSASAGDLVPATLLQLATRAANRGTWSSLRRYGRAQKDPEWRGWAYFLAGYYEYESESFPEAAEDLQQAAASGFSLADYAVFYQASATSGAGQSLEAADTLKDFATRFPQSYLRWQALELSAGAWLDAQKTQDAIDALTAEPEVRTRPTLALLLARAYQQANRLQEAARAFQEVYFAFPMSPQAQGAAEALETLRAQLGPAYPTPTDEIRTARGEILFRAARYDDALREFEGLRQTEPASPHEPRWQLGQARCLLRLRRTADALEALANHFATPDLEAQRLALLVQVHAQQSDAGAITEDLKQLETQYASSPAYAEALSAAGDFYYRQVDWQEAASAYGRLFGLFPQNQHAREDGWRLAWCNYLLHNSKAPDAMRDYLQRFPDSARAPAALYWLGRTQEELGAVSEARALYALLGRRFAHSYYTRQAAARLAALPADQGGPADAGAPASGSLAAMLAPVLQLPAIPQSLPCLSSSPRDAVRPVMILQALGLQDLADEYLKAAVAESAAPAELRLLLARMDAAQKNASGALLDALRIVPAYAQVDFSELPKEVWGFLYPQPYWRLVQRQARANRLDPYMVMGLIRQESAFNPRALSRANARGLMQILPETAARSHRASRMRSAARRLYDPVYNVRTGCAYLREMMKTFDNRPELALAAYHAGDFRVKDWLAKTSFQDPVMFLESIPIPATRSYVELVLRDAEIYRQLLTGSPRFAVCPGSKAATVPRAAGSARRTSTAEGPRHQRASGQ